VTPTTPITDGQRRWGATVPLLGLVGCIVVVILAIGGCSSDARYRTLSFFFDGVPDPHAPAGSAAARGEKDEFAPNAPIVKVYVHKPYADGLADSSKCSVCHVGSSGGFENFTAVSANVCLNCHKNKLTQYPVMHGPVVAVECTICHAAHESTIPGMLNYEAPKVCVQCHDRDLLGPKPPEHLLPDSKCLSCHVGHGGPKHKMLRTDAIAIAPPRAATKRPNPPAARPAGGGA
jgi:predicted CXXCH cytochrome family protein